MWFLLALESCFSLYIFLSEIPIMPTFSTPVIDNYFQNCCLVLNLIFWIIITFSIHIHLQVLKILVSIYLITWFPIPPNLVCKYSLLVTYTIIHPVVESQTCGSFQSEILQIFFTCKILKYLIEVKWTWVTSELQFSFFLRSIFLILFNIVKL